MKLNIPAGPLVYDTELKDIPRKVLRDLYRVMLRIQKVELKVDELYHEDEMKTPVHLCLGEEAIAAGVCADLNTEDYVFTNHRGHGHYIAKGGDIKKMVAELYNRETGCSRGRGGSMHLIDVAAGLPGSSSIVAGNSSNRHRCRSGFGHTKRQTCRRDFLRRRRRRKKVSFTKALISPCSKSCR